MQHPTAVSDQELQNSQTPMVTVTVTQKTATALSPEPCALRMFRHQSDFLSAPQSVSRVLSRRIGAQFSSGNSVPETCAMRTVRAGAKLLEIIVACERVRRCGDRHTLRALIYAWLLRAG